MRESERKREREKERESYKLHYVNNCCIPGLINLENDYAVTGCVTILSRIPIIHQYHIKTMNKLLFKYEVLRIAFRLNKYTIKHTYFFRNALSFKL